MLRIGAALVFVSAGAGCAPPMLHQPAGTPHCVTGGADTVATNGFFEFQVETPARPLPPTTAQTSGSRAVAVTFTVDTAGVPKTATIHTVVSTDSALVSALRPAVSVLRYEPARLEGCRVQQVVQQTVWLP